MHKNIKSLNITNYELLFFSKKKKKKKKKIKERKKKTMSYYISNPNNYIDRPKTTGWQDWFYLITSPYLHFSFCMKRENALIFWPRNKTKAIIAW